MKRAGGLLEGILQWDNLLLAFCRAERGLSEKYEADIYRLNLNDNLRFLRDGLVYGNFPFGEYHSFEVRDPKTRMIHAPAFRERVAQHSIFNICEPVLDRKLIDDSFACRTGKGTHGALRRAQVFARRYEWFLKLDVRRFFDSVVHATLVEMLGSIFKDERVLFYSIGFCRGMAQSLVEGCPLAVWPRSFLPIITFAISIV